MAGSMTARALHVAGRDEELTVVANPRVESEKLWCLPVCDCFVDTATSVDGSGNATRGDRGRFCSYAPPG
jgi:hypothetical protein